MIIDHNRSLPKSGNPRLSTPNKSPSPLPHKPTPQQTAKTQQVHTHQSDESPTDKTSNETTTSDPLLAMVHQPLTPLMMMFQTSPRFFPLRGLGRSKPANATSSSMPIIPTINW